MVDMLKGIWSDLVYAARSLAKARAFTFVCIVSLGIGMAPVIAVPYLARIPRIPPPGVNTEGLVEVITTANGSRPATNSWSYPDFMDLRNSDTGIAIFAWATAPSEIKLPGGLKLAVVADVRLGRLLPDDRRAAGARTWIRRADGRRRDSGIPVLAEPPEFRSGDHR